MSTMGSNFRYTQSMAKKNKAPTVVVSVRMPPDLYERLAQEAATDTRSLSNLIVHLLTLARPR